MTTTIETITDTQIATLQDEAASAGDHDMVKFCEIALGIYLNEDGNYPTTTEMREAREECADAIRAAEDMGD